MRHQPGGGVIEGVDVPGVVPRPRDLGGDDPMLIARGTASRNVRAPFSVAC
jgi:hypothetical protein